VGGEALKGGCVGREPQKDTEGGMSWDGVTHL